MSKQEYDRTTRENRKRIELSKQIDRLQAVYDSRRIERLTNHGTAPPYTIPVYGKKAN